MSACMEPHDVVSPIILKLFQYLAARYFKMNDLLEIHIIAFHPLVSGK
jgi:hypothetical protein